MIINFGEYLPDQPAFGNPGLTKANNCIPYGTSYRPLPSLNALSSAIASTAKGGFSTRDNGGTSYTYAGDTSTLYRLSSSTFIDASSGVYATDPADSWEFTKWGNKVIATNFADAVQEISLGASNFSALAGSPPKARHVAVVRDFLVLGNTDSAGASTPNRIHWSGFDNIETWTPAAATQCDFQDLQGEGGWIQKIIGGEYGTIFQERSIWRMTYIGSPIVFQFDEIEPGKGTPCPNSVVKVGKNIFYLGQDDFYMFNGVDSVPIGNERIYKTFISTYDATYYYNVWAAKDPINPIVVWSYPSTSSTGGLPDKLLVFNWADNKWSEGDLETEVLCNFQAQSLTLEQLDNVNTSIDALVHSLDSRVWKGTSFNLAGFNSFHQLCTFDGSDLTATFETGEKQLYPGRRGLITNTRPLVDSASSVTVQSGVKNLRSETLTYGTETSITSDGECPLTNEGRYHGFRIKVSGGFKQAYGIEIDTSPGGRY